ncbi:Lrp/AsnC family transcriptional regulator [Candidatus Woesearchaeota archaeon]|nr:Lrp/AsnC family transcriptional regulator [Candidatus Woesearchaeota archaeon]
MLTKTEMVIMAYLRSNARLSLTDISKKTETPISTIHDKLKYRYGGVIQKYTALVNFAALGYNTRAQLILRVKKEDRNPIREFLVRQHNVNSLYRINNGYDFLMECVFSHLKELEAFIDYLENKFSITEKQVYYMIEDLKREDFLSNPELFPFQEDLAMHAREAPALKRERRRPHQEIDEPQAG